MEKSCELYNCVNSLSSVLYSQIVETDAHITSLQHKASILSQGQEIDQAAGEIKVDRPEQEWNDERVILELEKSRLNLVMDIQEQDFITSRLREMIGECEDLAGGIATFYRVASLEESKERTANGLDDTWIDKSSNNTTEILNANLSELGAKLEKLSFDSKHTLEDIKKNGDKMDSPEYQSDLKSLIDTINSRVTNFISASTTDLDE